MEEVGLPSPDERVLEEEPPRSGVHAPALPGDDLDRDRPRADRLRPRRRREERERETLLREIAPTIRNRPAEPSITPTIGLNRKVFSIFPARSCY